MFNSLTGRTPHVDGPPDDARPHRARKRLGALFTLASALALSFAFLSAPLPAQAQSSIDGQWSVVHGGTGLVTLNIDGSYTSTCEAFPNYPDAWCPAPSGTFLYASGYVDFHGADGSTHSYRVGGLVASPDIIKSTFGSRTFSPLVMVPGQRFVCTDWSGTGTSFTRYGVNPLVDYDAAADMLYATGSHDPLGSSNIANTINLAETAPNYFQSGQCSDFPTPPALPALIIDSVRDASIPAGAGYWLPQAIVTIKDATGAPVAGAIVQGVTTYSYGQSCVTVADGTCTVSARSTVENSTAESGFAARWPTKDGMQWDGHAVLLTLQRPATPPPATHHIGDLDNATTAPSSLLKWQPKVTATVLDSTGNAVAGATVSGKFSHHKGTLTCTTGVNGTCTLGNFSFRRSITSTAFTVTNVTLTSSTYAPKTNTDPDGDSNGTTITVKR